MNQKELFLKLAKGYVAKGNLTIVPRTQNLDFIRQYGLTTGTVREIIQALTEDDFIDGPEPDRDDQYKEWTVAEFAPYYRSKKLYLKISIRVSQGRCKCLSIKLFRDKEL